MCFLCGNDISMHSYNTLRDQFENLQAEHQYIIRKFLNQNARPNEGVNVVSTMVSNFDNAVSENTVCDKKEVPIDNFL